MHCAGDGKRVTTSVAQGKLRAIEPPGRGGRNDWEEHMGIGDVFAKAWELWKRDVGWLILAGLVVGLIMMVVFGVAFAIFVAIFAGAGVSFGADLANDTTSSLTGLGAGLLVLAFLVYMVAVFVLQVVSMTFYGGMFEMVIGAAREDRGVRFGDLFSAFRKLGAYTLFALVLFGVSLGVSILNAIPLVGWLAGMAISTWVYVIWLYVLPLIADQGMGFGEAAARSNAMVKGVGWWRTFGMVVVLGLAIAAALIVILLIAVGIGQAEEWAGIAVGLLLFLVFAILVPPYTICYVSVMYLGSAHIGEPVRGGLPGIPPAPPAPPAPAYGTPASPVVAAPPAGAATAVTSPGVPPGPPAPPPSGDDAWKAAADPLATAPPPPPVVPPAAGQAAGQPPAVPPLAPAQGVRSGAPADEGEAADAVAPAVDDVSTAVTQPPPAEAPMAPEPPAPPEPPASA